MKINVRRTNGVPWAFKHTKSLLVGQQNIPQDAYTVLNYCQDYQIAHSQQRVEFTYPRVSKDTGLNIAAVKDCVLILVERKQLKFIDAGENTFALKGHHTVESFSKGKRQIHGWEDLEEIEDQIAQLINDSERLRTRKEQS